MFIKFCISDLNIFSNFSIHFHSINCFTLLRLNGTKRIKLQHCFCKNNEKKSFTLMSGHFKTSLSQKPIKGFLKEKNKNYSEETSRSHFCSSSGFPPFVRLCSKCATSDYKVRIFSCKIKKPVCHSVTLVSSG